MLLISLVTQAENIYHIPICDAVACSPNLHQNHSVHNFRRQTIGGTRELANSLLFPLDQLTGLDVIGMVITFLGEPG